MARSESYPWTKAAWRSKHQQGKPIEETTATPTLVDMDDSEIEAGPSHCVALDSMAINVRECSNRQVAAASTAALFNLVFQASTSKPLEVERQTLAEAVPSPPFPLTTAQTFQTMQTSSLRIDNDAEEDEYNRTTSDIEKLGIVGVSNSLPLASDEQTQFAFTTSEPTRMDTGTEYIKKKKNIASTFIICEGA